MSEVHAGTDADLQHIPIAPGDDGLSNLLDRLRISQPAYNMRIDMIFIVRHCGSMLSFGSRAARPSVPALTAARKISRRPP
jgi:hypothetical protein